jgi:8-oxo-dGTP diphosphatase
VVTEPGVLRLWRSDDFTYSDGFHHHYEVYAGSVDLTDDDIVVGEGRAIVFVDPEQAGDLDLAESTAHFLPLFLASDHYRELTGGIHP